MEEKNIYSEITDKYLSNYRLQIKLDEELYEPKSREAWKDTFPKRAERLQELFAENQYLTGKMQELLSEPLTETSAEQIYNQVYRIFWDERCFDPSFCLPIIYKLIPYYEAQDSMRHLILLYHAAYFVEAEIQTSSREERQRQLDFLKKIVAYRHRYSEFAFVEKSLFWSAFHNMSVVALSEGTVDLETSYRYWKDAMSFWESEEVQADYARTGLSPLRNLNRWAVNADPRIENAPQEIRDEFCRVIKQLHEEEMARNPDILPINSDFYAGYLHRQVLQGEKTYDEIVDEYFDYYLKKINSDLDLENLPDEDLFFITNLPLKTERWLRKGVNAQKNKMIMLTFHENLQKFWRLKCEASSFITDFFAIWCSKIIRYLDATEEKINCICQLLLQRQLPTYLHSVMVMRLSEILCKEALRVRPSLFSDLEEIPQQDMTKFVTRCGLLHDLGKTRIADIINTQFRKITDREFCAIEEHPNYGAELLSVDEDLVKYRDVIIGHHKFYDGSAGYPAEFDNTESRYRIIIDIVTICDCIDAATDYLGRNYKNAKTFDQVLQELTDEKGTRYNPHLVDLIESSQGVQRAMRQLVEEERLDLMYHAYVDGLN